MKVRVRRVSAEEIPVEITTEFIKLESFLKLANAVSSGGMAKNFIQDGAVTVGGGFWGIPGMIVGVPITATCYALLREDLHRRDGAHSPEGT